MRAKEFVTEIDYTAGVEGLDFNSSNVIQNSELAGDIDYCDVWMFAGRGQQMYYFKSDDKIDAFVVIEDNPTDGYYHLRGVNNISKKHGHVTALIGFLTHRLKMKLKISKFEQLSTLGFSWLKSLLLAKGRGLTITDQSGKFPDVEKLESEWIAAMQGIEHGPTEIIFESKMTRILESKIESEKHLVRKTWFIGDTNIL